MYACNCKGRSRHSDVFATFLAESLTARVNDASAEVVITAGEVIRDAKKITFKTTVENALEPGSQNSVCCETD